MPDVQSSDLDADTADQWQANLRVLDVKETCLTFRCRARLWNDWLGRFVENTWTKHYSGRADLEEQLRVFQRYFNRHRAHSGLEGGLPEPGEAQATLSFASYRWPQHCRGLFQTPIAA